MEIDPISHSPAVALFRVLSALIPTLLLSSLLIPGAIANRMGKRFASTLPHFALGILLLAISASVALWGWHPPEAKPITVGVPPLTLYFDRLSSLMVLLVSFLGWVISRFSVQYLAGDPAQGRFCKWLASTILSVLTLTISGNLALFTGAWITTSLSLHQLLTFYPERPAALRAARLKFVISRIGDACLVGALILAWKTFGTLEFSQLFPAPAIFGALNDPKITTISFLLVASAILKSAQFPFHSWLPDTMETPTPVSALMHAGIINAGGFLVLRMSPLIAITPSALHTLLAFGAITALFASAVMLTQTSIKRSLAYSTVAQMGFMMLECGLGAFALAILHILAHSLYKAHAFLSSGSTIEKSRFRWSPSPTTSLSPMSMATLGVLALGITYAIASLWNSKPDGSAGSFLLTAVFCISIAQLLWSVWLSSHHKGLLGFGLILCTATAACYFSLHSLFHGALFSSPPHHGIANSPAELVLAIGIGVAFVALQLFQTRLHASSRSPLGRALFVHASHGFYVGTVADQLLSKALPKHNA
ncbi:MAG: hypothetical protein RLZZ399_1680 [Verrucomicrobiota bacterium]